ncbi:MAG: PHB depolymerase family esterase [Cyclobacteriaceae bacterium]
MLKKFYLILAVITTATVSMVSAQQTAKVTASGTGYLEYLPQGYNSNNDKYPIVIALHGIKEKGTSSKDPNLVKAGVLKVANVGLAKYVKYGAKYPFILISPQLKKSHGTWPAEYVMEVLNHVKKNLRVDDRRIYLTGLSLGGFGVWKTAGEYPSVFAAIAPICSGGNSLGKANDIAAQNLPAWGFHGGSDKVVSYKVTTKMIDAINSAPKRPTPLAKLTIFPGMNHVIWDKAYKETSVLTWMLGYKKGETNDNDNDDGGEDGDGDADEDGDGEDGDGDGDEDGDEEEVENSDPIVDAGSDRSIILPTNSLYIQAQASDQDGSIEFYQWTKISGGSSTLKGASSPKLRALDLIEGEYVFRLTVKDNKGSETSDDVTVNVVKGSSEEEEEGEEEEEEENQTPFVFAGQDKTVNLPSNAINIQGKASDKDGSIESYQWTKVYGAASANLSGTTEATLRVSNLERGAYIFKFTAIDNKGGSESDLVKVTVKNKDVLPIVSAGPDKIISLPNNTISLQGQASAKDGKIVSYQWTKTYGGKLNQSGSTGSTLRISNLERGAYIFRLTAKDNDGNLNHDYVKVTVRSRNGT